MNKNVLLAGLFGLVAGMGLMPAAPRKRVADGSRPVKGRKASDKAALAAADAKRNRRMARNVALALR